MLSTSVCNVISWIVLPLDKAIWVFVYTLLYSLCIGRATDGEWWEDIKRLKHTAFFPHSEPPAQKDFLKLALRRVLFQSFWTPSPFSFTHTIGCFCPIVYFEDLGLWTQPLFTVASLLTERSDLLRINERNRLSCLSSWQHTHVLCACSSFSERCRTLMRLD